VGVLLKNCVFFIIVTLLSKRLEAFEMNKVNNEYDVIGNGRVSEEVHIISQALQELILTYGTIRHDARR